jgi:hydroxymethylglutaryl-CoA reductase
MKMGLMTGIAILSNYCTERKAIAWFEIPTKLMGRKGFEGSDVARKIL